MALSMESMRILWSVIRVLWDDEDELVLRSLLDVRDSDGKLPLSRSGDSVAKLRSSSTTKSSSVVRSMRFSVSVDCGGVGCGLGWDWLDRSPLRSLSAKGSKGGATSSRANLRLYRRPSLLRLLIMEENWEWGSD